MNILPKQNSKLRIGESIKINYPIFIRLSVLGGWFTAYCINCLMVPIYMIPFGFAGGAIFLIFLLLLVLIALGIIYFGLERALTKRRTREAIRYVLLPVAIFVVSALLVTHPLAEFSHTLIYGERVSNEATQSR